MKGHIPETILESIVSRVDIVELIGNYIPLKRIGRNYKALCPFHHEKTASFIVSADKQIYHCFGCGAGGNALNFFMQYERLEFREAVEVLARRVGVSLPETDYQKTQTAGINEELRTVNELTAAFYEQHLFSPEGKQAREYLAQRGIKKETALQFRLGLAPSGWDGLITHLRAKNIRIGLVEKAGLVLPKESGGYYDRFRNRIMFPISDARGSVVAFGGRQFTAQEAQKQDSPKYVNSPETPLYVKGKHLYGLQCAKDAIRQDDYACVVEGYLDFMTPFQEGVRNLVASLGTALTTDQIRLLRRYTKNVTIIYDGDNAGESATLRSLDLLVEEGMNVKVVSLPKGYDPDLFVRTHGGAHFSEAIVRAEGLFEYKMRILRSRYRTHDAHDKARICGEMISTIVKYKNEIVKSEFLKRLAQELEVAESAITAESRKVEKGSASATAAGNGSFVPQAPGAKANPTEQLLMKLMLEENRLIGRVREQLAASDFRDANIAKIVSLMFELAGTGKKVEPRSIVNQCESPELSKLVCESTCMEVADDKKEQILEDCIRRVQVRNLNEKKSTLHHRIRIAQETGDQESLESLMKEFQSLIKRGKESK